MSGKTLICGYRSGDLTDRLMALKPVVHVFDIYHAHAIHKVWRWRCECTPHVPAGPYERAFLKTGKRLMSAELQLDLLQEIYANLEEGAVLEVTFEGSEADALDGMKKVFPKVKKIAGDKHKVILECRREGELKRVREFSSVWSASVPGGRKLDFTSFPGCFCHRRPDEGGLSLAEVVSKELTSGSPLAVPQFPINLLDMGCGCGLVGLLVADRVGNVHPTLIDSHSRAIEAAKLNAEKFGIAADFILSDDGITKDMLGTQDVFVGNPPYYSDYQIAEVFMMTAYAALKPGGVCYTVVKTATGLIPVQEKYFRKVEVIKRRGYAILKSIR